MELFSLFLQIHIAGAFGLASLLLLTVVSLLQASTSLKLYKSLAIGLAVVTGLEVVTGSVMYVLATDANLVAFCGKMAIYLSLTAIAEYALIRRLQSLAVAEV